MTHTATLPDGRRLTLDAAARTATLAGGEPVPGVWVEGRGGWLRFIGFGLPEEWVIWTHPEVAEALVSDLTPHPQAEAAMARQILDSLPWSEWREGRPGE